jgi:hypothetical protein
VATGRRLISAKAKIRESGVIFELREASELLARLDAVAEAKKPEVRRLLAFMPHCETRASRHDGLLRNH